MPRTPGSDDPDQLFLDEEGTITMDMDEAYDLALRLVDFIDCRLTVGVPFKDNCGRLLDQLGQVTHAIARGTLHPDDLKYLTGRVGVAATKEPP